MNVITQVGYHYRYVGAFTEMKRVIDSGALGNVSHVHAEAFGPVVLKTNSGTWRADKKLGGGCLYDYAAHPINLINWYFGEPTGVSGSILSSIFSEGIDDEVYSTFHWDNGMSAQLAVNWSDESFRKMSTAITATGTNGRVYADRQECRTYLRSGSDGLQGYNKGWNVRYTTELTEPVGFYLRGEEYSAQMENFIDACLGRPSDVRNSFQSAAETDRTIAKILSDQHSKPTRSRLKPISTTKRRSFFRV